MSTVMGVDQFETLTMDDKEKRDDIFRRLRETGDANEKRAVRFSDVRLQMGESEGEIATDERGRARYVSTFSVAYPTTPMQRKSRKNKVK